GLGRDDAFGEELALTHRSGVEPALETGFDGRHGGVRRGHAFRGFRQRRSHRLARLEPRLDGVRAVRNLADLADPATSGFRFRERNGAVEEIVRSAEAFALRDDV